MTDHGASVPVDLDAIEQRLARTRTHSDLVETGELVDTADALVAAVRALRAERDDDRASFDLWHAAEVRGIEDWRAGHPERELVLPDARDWTRWLIEDRERLRAERDEMATHVAVLELLVDGAQVQERRLRAALGGLVWVTTTGAETVCDYCGRAPDETETLDPSCACAPLRWRAAEEARPCPDSP